MGSWRSKQKFAILVVFVGLLAILTTSCTVPQAQPARQEALQPAKAAVVSGAGSLSDIHKLKLLTVQPVMANPWR